MDDPIERALAAVYAGGFDAVGDDRSPMATALAVVLREQQALPAAVYSLLADHWNWLACDPPLSAEEIAEAVRQAFETPLRHEPAVAATLPESPPHRAVVAERGDLQAAPRKAPLTVAERSRRYRQRKRARGLAAADAAARTTPLWIWEVPA